MSSVLRLFHLGDVKGNERSDWQEFLSCKEGQWEIALLYMRDDVGSRQKHSSVKFTVIVCRLRKVLKCDFFSPPSTNHVTYLWRCRCKCRCRRRCAKTVLSRNELTCPPGRPTGPSTPLSPVGPYGWIMNCFWRNLIFVLKCLSLCRA